MRSFRHRSWRGAILVAGVTVVLGGSAVALQWPGPAPGHATRGGSAARDVHFDSSCDDDDDQSPDTESPDTESPDTESPDTDSPDTDEDCDDPEEPSASPQSAIPSPQPAAPATTPPATPPASPAFDTATQCAPIRDAIVNKQSFDANLGQKCIEEESDPGHTGQVTTFGPVCQALDGLAHNGDLAFPVNVVIACEKTLQRGLRGNDGSLERATDICVTARKQQSSGVTIDPALDQVCAGEPA